jgi:EmrB/QacA subfamily drug resistance transporter
MASGGRGAFGAVAEWLEAPPADWIARQPNYPWLVVAVACIGAFIGQLDACIVQLAMPVMERQFDAGLSAVSWVATGYLLAFACALPVFARLSEITGRKRFYILGFLLFAIASLLCGFAPSLPVLIAGRMLQGVGGSLLGANSVVILTHAAGPERQGRAMGIFASAQAVGVGLGPAAGGVLVTALGWHWVFWVAVPFSLAGAVAGWMIVPRTPHAVAKGAFDWRGAVLLAPALATTLLVLTDSHAMSMTAVSLGIAAAVVLLVLFVREEHRVAAPLIALSLLRRVPFACGIVCVLLCYGLLYAMFFLMAFAFVNGDHETPLAAGIRLAIVPVTLGLVAPYSGALSGRYGARPLKLAGMLSCIGGLLLMSLSLSEHLSGLVQTAASLVLFGGGLGLFIAPNNSATMSAAPAEQSGVAGGLLNLMRVLGTSVGVAAASSVLAWRLEARLGFGFRLSSVAPETLFAAVQESMLLLLAMAGVAGLASLVSARPAVIPQPAPARS